MLCNCVFIFENIFVFLRKRASGLVLIFFESWVCQENIKKTFDTGGGRFFCLKNGRLKKYQRQMWKTNYFENKKKFKRMKTK